MNIRTVKEGETEILVPVHVEGVSFPPSAAPVFYNPVMELNRDISVAATSVFVKRLSEKYEREISDITYVDALSASGIRGLRIANEVGVSTTLNDWSEEAYNLILDNIDNLNLENAKGSCKNANLLLYESRYNIVDLDPFGTPAPFLAAAARSAVNMLEVTATDTAPLCGAHLNSGIRKYAAIPFNNEYHSEMGVRILLGKVARELSVHDKAMTPLLSHATRHYVRSYLEINKGAKRADKMLQQLGYISHCPVCGHRETHPGIVAHIQKSCSMCDSDTMTAGPLWLGQLHDPGFCQEVIEEIEGRELGTREHAIKIIELCMNELNIPTFYDQHLICKKLGLSASLINVLVDALKDNGFAASRTHFSGTSFKTDANISDIEKIILDIR
ncbi:tRNA (guanine(10)-N(2))-dimethyltransferase [Methanolobus sp. ZRKC3]|uniref:tRNA (guanine(10)-N(2))-dimethyltransferase n=1 Tax=Methanolobus sp. ZRKC3 TaxID=3125786 RepID=UPI003243535E